ncbi:hypothetical protein ABT024_05125 [Streptomyces sp. NPDC002812]|uniref:hypothetical protein n=1 Tax=Streptomyces sp. NPDC002812 TaxID=3154434 RepID=UPI00332B7C0B
MHLPPNPGFFISDIAHAAAIRLGPGWTAESGVWGVSGQVTSSNGRVFSIGVDDMEGDLFVSSDGVREPLPRLHPREGLERAADVVATAIRCSD